MTKHKSALARLFAACWKDEALKARLLADPKAVLKEHGLDVPDGIDVKVVENADDCVHITLPAPPAGDMDLSDEELSNAAGGGSCAAVSCAASPLGSCTSPAWPPFTAGGNTCLQCYSTPCIENPIRVNPCIQNPIY